MGLGRRILQDGRISEGFFFHGNLMGIAKEVYPDGQAFVGTVKNYAKHGKGEIWLQDGTCISGEWSHGKQVGEFCKKDLDNYQTLPEIQQTFLHQQAGPTESIMNIEDVLI